MLGNFGPNICFFIYSRFCFYHLEYIDNKLPFSFHKPYFQKRNTTNKNKKISSDIFAIIVFGCLYAYGNRHVFPR